MIVVARGRETQDETGHFGFTVSHRFRLRTDREGSEFRP